MTLNWTAPTSRADGSPLSLADIDGYRIYYGTAHASYTGKLDVPNGTAQSATLSSLVAGTTYYLVMTTYDINGLESGYSAEISKRAQ
jgi:fibronectin type 3 domain-containing protein